MGLTPNTLLIAFFDGIGESVIPTANFTPVSGHPLSYLTNSQLLLRTRTPDLTNDMQLTWDWGSAIEHNVFMLAGSNATLSATRRIRDADNSGFTVNVVQSGASLTSAFDTSLGFSRVAWVPPWGRILLYVYSSSVTKRYTRWHQSDPTNPDGYQEWGVARIGLSQQFTFHSWRTYGSSSGGGNGSSNTASKFLRTHEITLEFATRDEAYEAQSLYFSTLGLRRILVMPEPLNPAAHLHDAFWGILDNDFERETVRESPYGSKLFKMTLVFREVDR